MFIHHLARLYFTLNQHIRRIMYTSKFKVCLPLNSRCWIQIHHQELQLPRKTPACSPPEKVASKPNHTSTTKHFFDSSFQYLRNFSSFCTSHCLEGAGNVAVRSSGYSCPLDQNGSSVGYNPVISINIHSIMINFYKSSEIYLRIF